MKNRLCCLFFPGHINNVISRKQERENCYAFGHVIFILLCGSPSGSCLLAFHGILHDYFHWASCRRRCLGSSVYCIILLTSLEIKTYFLYRKKKMPSFTAIETIINVNIKGLFLGILIRLTRVQSFRRKGPQVVVLDLGNFDFSVLGDLSGFPR